MESKNSFRITSSDPITICLFIFPSTCGILGLFIHGGRSHLSGWLAFYSESQQTLNRVCISITCDDNSLDLSLGQLEETISKAFVKSANLRGLLIKEGCPTAIKHCTSHFNKLTDPEIRNSMLLDISTFLADPENDPSADEIPRIAIAQMTHAAIRTYFHGDAPRTMKPLSFFTINGLTYSTVKRHRGNSSVIVRHPSQPDKRVPAQIEDITQISDEVIFAVRFYRKPAVHDPFKQYPFLHASLWQPDLGQLAIVKPADVVSHFASMSFSQGGNEHIAIISLSRVC